MLLDPCANGRDIGGGGANLCLSSDDGLYCEGESLVCASERSFLCAEEVFGVDEDFLVCEEVVDGVA